MMNNIKTILLIFSLLFTMSLSAQMAPDIHQDDNCGGINNNAFQGGEKLVYKLYYNWKFVWIPAGEVKFNVIENKNASVDTLYLTLVNLVFFQAAHQSDALLL